MEKLMEKTYRWNHYNQSLDFRGQTRCVLKYDNLKKYTFFEWDKQDLEIAQKYSCQQYVKQSGLRIQISKIFTIITGITITSPNQTTVTLIGNADSLMIFDVQVGTHYYPIVIPSGLCLYTEFYLKSEYIIEYVFEYILLPIDYFKALCQPDFYIFVPEYGFECNHGSIYFNPELQEHNKHLKALGKPTVEMVNHYQYKQVKILYEQLPYEPGGEKYLESERKIYENFLKIM